MAKLGQKIFMIQNFTSEERTVISENGKFMFNSQRGTVVPENENSFSVHTLRQYLQSANINPCSSTFINRLSKKMVIYIDLDYILVYMSTIWFIPRMGPKTRNDPFEDESKILLCTMPDFS